MAHNHDIFPQLVPMRVSRLRQTIESMIWAGLGDLKVVGGPVNSDPLPLKEGCRQKMRPVKAGEFFGPPYGGWNQRWFRIDLPRARDPGKRYLFWKCHGETTVWHDGVPWAGLDPAHGYCRLPEDAKTIWLDCGTYQTAIWGPQEYIGPHGLRFDRAYLARRNEPAWEIFHDLLVLHDLMQLHLDDMGWSRQGSQPWDFKPELVEASPVLRVLLRQLDRACDAYDRDGLEALGKCLKTIFHRFPAEQWQPDAVLTGHSHLDLVWMWPENEGERKGVHTTSSMLRLLEDYPEFQFTQSQPALQSAIERISPPLMQQVRKMRQKGRWNFTGGMYVEAENNLPCGEALARCLAYGQREFARLRGGSYSRIVWIPDCFGFSASLPQLMKLSGLDYFFTGKLTWCPINRFPHNSFTWRGPDGSAVLSHVAAGFGGSMKELVHGSRKYRQADVHDQIMMWVGAGDGGGGTNEREIEVVQRMANLAGVPKARWQNPEMFFKRLAKVQDQLPVYDGELYLEYHRGTFTTQSDLKLLYRRAEKALQARESLRALMGKGAIGLEAWERVLFTQFHDALPGSSINLVYQQINAQLKQLAADQLGQTQKELTAGRSTKKWTVFNPLLLGRSCVVEITAADARGIETDDGQPVLSQKTADGLLALVEMAPASTRQLRSSTTATETPKSTWNVSARLLDNGMVKAVFDPNGRLKELTSNGRGLCLAAPGGFTLHPDRPAEFDAWDIDQPALRLGKEVADSIQLKVIEKGPVRAILRGRSDIGKNSRLTVDYILQANSPWLGVRVQVDWKEKQQLLKYHLPTGYLGSTARYGTPFGSIARPQLPGHPRNQAMWEVSANRWAALGHEDGSDGLAVITEAKYGFSCYEGDLGLSLLRSPMDPGNNGGQQVDHGHHDISFAIGRYAQQTQDNQLSTPAAAEALFGPLVVCQDGRKVACPFTLEQIGSLVPSWLMPAETGKGFVIRLHETVGGRGRALLRFEKPVRSVKLVDLLERPIGQLRKLTDDTWAIDYEPFKVISVMVKPA